MHAYMNPQCKILKNRFRYYHNGSISCKIMNILRCMEKNCLKLLQNIKKIIGFFFLKIMILMELSRKDK